VDDYISRLERALEELMEASGTPAT
jgi:hypothetical protein